MAAARKVEGVKKCGAWLPPAGLGTRLKVELRRVAGEEPLGGVPDGVRGGPVLGLQLLDPLGHLLDVAVIREVTSQVALPVNVMVGIGAPSLDELAAAGVRRLSQGGEPFLAVVGVLKALTDRYLAGELGASPEPVGVGASLITALLK